MLNALCCLLRTLLTLTILANPFACDQQRTVSTILNLGSFFLFDHLFVSERMSIVWFQSPTFCSASWSSPLQTMDLYLIPHSPATYATSTYCVKIEEGGLDLFSFHFIFIFIFDLFFYFLFLEQLGLGLISHAVTSVTT